VIGGITDLNICHDTSVCSVVPFPNDPQRFQVSFLGFSPIWALTSDQCGFARIHATLGNAVGTGQMVWVALHSEEPVDEPDEDGLIATLPKIMDVRPV
jgi:hypothetical protein